MTSHLQVHTPDSTHATPGPTQQRAAVIGTERGAAPCTPRARLNGAAALCAAAVTLAGEVLWCPMRAYSDMFKVHKMAIIGEIDWGYLSPIMGYSVTIPKYIGVIL